MFQFISVPEKSARREAVTEEQVVAFLGPAHDLETERWRALGRSRFQALSEEQILQAVSGPVESGGSSLFPTARVSDVPVPAHPLEYVDRQTARAGRDTRGEIGTLPLLIRWLRVSVWLAAGALMFVGMIWK